MPLGPEFSYTTNKADVNGDFKNASTRGKTTFLVPQISLCTSSCLLMCQSIGSRLHHIRINRRMPAITMEISNLSFPG